MRARARGFLHRWRVKETAKGRLSSEPTDDDDNQRGDRSI